MRCTLSAASLAAALLLVPAVSGLAEDRKPAPPGPVAGKPADTSENMVGFLGIGLDEVDDALAYHLNLENDLGVMITMIAPKSPAQTMGLKRFDVVVAVDGKPIYTPRALQGIIRGKKDGETVEVTVRRGATSETLSGPVSTRPERVEEGRPGFGRRMPGAGDPPPRHGKLVAPDGGTMEWSVEENP